MAGKKDETDVAFEVKTAFYLGNFQQCISVAQKIKGNPELKKELDIFMYRAYIAQKRYAVVLDDIRGSSSPDLQSVRLYASYLSGEQTKEGVLKQVDVKVSSGNLDVANVTTLLMYASIYMHEGQYESVLKLLHSSDALECVAMSIEALLKMERADLARRELKRLQELDEDSIVTQLTSAHVQLAAGGADKLQEAWYTIRELADRHGATPTTLNLEAACLIAQGKLEDAEPVLQEALDKDANCPETLINLLFVAHRLGKPIEITNRYVSQLREAAPNHPFVRDMVAKEKELERLVKAYAPMN